MGGMDLSGLAETTMLPLGPPSLIGFIIISHILIAVNVFIVRGVIVFKKTLTCSWTVEEALVLQEVVDVAQPSWWLPGLDAGVGVPYKLYPGQVFRFHILKVDA